MTEPRKLKREKASIVKIDGKYHLIPPQHLGLVLSGGGAKGIAYEGVIRALEERGYLKNITHISGASAGAMSASVLALGISTDDFGKLVQQLDIFKLMDPLKFGVRGQGPRFRNVLDLIYMVQMKQHLDALQEIPDSKMDSLNHLLIKIEKYVHALQEQGLTINSVDDIIKLAQDPNNLEKMDTAFKKFDSSGYQHITFNDLKVLRDVMPDEKKHLIKNLSIVVTNQTNKTLEHYGEDENSARPLAEIVQWSGAHPILFRPARNEKGEYVADGGILDNMPEILGLDREQVLAVRAEDASTYESSLKRANNSKPEKISRLQKSVDVIARVAIGGNHLKASAEILNREKVYHNLDNMIYVNSGEVTTTSTSPTPEQKEAAINNAYQQTSERLDSQTKVFDHPLMVVLYVGVDNLNSYLQGDEDLELQYASGVAQAISHLQDKIVSDISEGDYSSVRFDVAQIRDILRDEAQMDIDMAKKAYSLCLKQVNFMSEGKFLDFVSIEMYKEVKEKQFGWATQAVDLLLRPIQWVISTVSSSFSSFKQAISDLKQEDPAPSIPAPNQRMS